MTVKFENKNNGKIAVHENVSLMTTGTTMLGTTGYGLDFEDGTCCVVSKKSWTLISVKG